ncbi:MAG TPA: hypothetical protein VFF69_04130 [Phycisphaerales bacterium]|nr:hypothetical protein [Phycisphaerales bacterium]
MKAPLARLTTLAFALTTVAAAWCGMMIVHEFGHVLAAWLSGGLVSRVVLHPLAFSRTDLAENPHPLLVAWGGPAFGSALPVVLWLSARALRLRLAFLLRFFAGFCLLANGVYLASAAIMPVGDAEDLIRLSAPHWTIMVPGAVAAVGGLAMWNRLGADFGLGDRPVDRAALITSAVSLATLVIGMLIWSATT